MIYVIIAVAVLVMILVIVYHNGAGRGAEAVSRGEILYQKKEKGQTFSETERKVCFHPRERYVQHRRFRNGAHLAQTQHMWHGGC